MHRYRGLMDSGAEIVTGEALRAAREAAGLSLSAMAARTHYSKPSRDAGLASADQRRVRRDRESQHRRCGRGA
ncbi:hypothetical protein FMUBM48_07320 [Nocardia cyriacigeorgica]|nr:hypothetical protein FMUBM48_07320 [Nocardia cyriacigeorgica]